MPDALINGAHAILYSRDAERDRAFLRNVLALPSVDVGHGWLIFGLPPAEIAVHPADGNDRHELYLMTGDLQTFISTMKARGVACTPAAAMGWGTLTTLTLPGGGKLGVYEPRHARSEQPARPAARPRKTTSRSKRPRPTPARAKRPEASTRRPVTAKGARRRR